MSKDLVPTNNNNDDIVVEEGEILLTFYDSNEKTLINAGSIEAASKHVGLSNANKAMEALISRTPPELRGSEYHVIGYHRLEHKYQIANAAGDLKSAAVIQQMILSMVDRLY